MDAKTMAGLITDHNFGELKEKVITNTEFEKYTKDIIEAAMKGTQPAYNTGLKDGLLIGLGISVTTAIGVHVIKRCKKNKLNKLED